MEKAVQGSIGVPITGEMCRCGTKEHGLVIELNKPGWWLELKILSVFSNIDDSMILNRGVCDFLSFTTILTFIFTQILFVKTFQSHKEVL